MQHPSPHAATPSGYDRIAVPGVRPAAESPDSAEPCLRCAFLLPRRLMGCKGGHCPNCGHLYPHGDCSD